MAKPPPTEGLGGALDSLTTVIQTAGHDTAKVKAMQQLAWTLMYSNPDTATILCEQALELLGADNLKGEGDSPPAYFSLHAAVLKTLGAVNYIQSSYPEALEYYFKSLKIYEQLLEQVKQSGNPDEAGRYKKGMAASYNNIGLIYMNQSSYPQALEYYFKSLKIYEQPGDKKGMAISYNNIGIIYYNQSSYPQALEYYFKSLKIEEQLSNKRGMAYSYENIGIIYQDQSDYPLALGYYFKSLKIKKELGDKQGMANAYTNIGSLYTVLYTLGDSPPVGGVAGWAVRNPALLLDTAMYYQQKALALNKELSDEYGMTISLSCIGSVYAQKQEYTKAIKHYQQAALLADSIGVLQRGSEAYSGLAGCYEQMAKGMAKSPLPRLYRDRRGDLGGLYKLALEHYKQYTTLKDSIFNEEKSKEIGKLEARHEMEMAEMKRKQEEEEQARILEQQIQRRHLLQYSGILIFIIAVIVMLLFSGRLNIPVRLAKSGVFFTFLLVFEFVLVLIDPYIEQWTGGEPAYNLAVNVALAGLFLPLHNFAVSKLEQRLFKTRKKIATKAQRKVIGEQ